VEWRKGLHLGILWPCLETLDEGGVQCPPNYNRTKLIMTIKSFVIQALGYNDIKLPVAVI
jgi:hypothetical protein